MNKTCARCEKTVYPIEELKCLDKIWHKGCFKCQECSMTLNMKTYKGYGKLPYCEAHVPKVKPTTMAVTPELTRIAENTKLQSNVNYHADFEKSKGKYTQVADDPETLRIKATTKIISNVAYHGELEKKAAMEKQRNLNENGDTCSENQQSDNYHQQIESYATEMLPPKTQPNQHSYQTKEYQPQKQKPENNYHSKSYQQPQTQQASYKNQPQTHHQQPQGYSSQPPSYNHPPQATDYQNSNRDYYPAKTYPAQSAYDDYSDASRAMISQERAGYTQAGKIGRIADYDPISDGPRPTPYTQRPAATLIYNSSAEQRGAQNAYNNHAQQLQQQQMQQQQLQLHQQQQLQLQQQQQQLQLQQQQQLLLQQQQQRAKQNTTPLAARVYVAMYDYEATDTDEVSFREGDLIGNVTSIDEGWMTGRVLRTGHTGMLPANYVQLAN